MLDQDSTSPSDAPARQRSWWTAMFLFALLLGGASVAILLPLGFFAPVIVVGGLLFFGMLGFHYLVWGRWIERVLREEREAAEDQLS